MRTYMPASRPLPRVSLRHPRSWPILEHMKQEAGPKFRETLWFKRGELGLDQAAAKQPEADEEPSAVMLPIEDAYLDDGSVSSDDTATFGLHVGGSQYVPVIKGAKGGDPGAHVEVLVREMKRGRARVLATMGAFVAVAALAVMYLS